MKIDNTCPPSICWDNEPSIDHYVIRYGRKSILCGFAQEQEIRVSANNGATSVYSFNIFDEHIIKSGSTVYFVVAAVRGGVESGYASEVTYTYQKPVQHPPAPPRRFSAASCARQDVLDAIDAASKGDTILIPLGKSDFIEKFLTLKFEAIRMKGCNG